MARKKRRAAQAIDQDPYFRMTRDVAPRLGFLKPALLHSKFFPALQGANSKMSASDESSAIFCTDTPQQIEFKVKTYAFSGGQAKLEDHRRLGGDLTTDIPYQWLTFFQHDDAELKRVGDSYSSGEMTSGAIKGELVKVLKPLVERHQRARAAVTDDIVRTFMTPRRLRL